MSGTQKFLTIRGETASMTSWARRPGAARYHTIVNRLLHGWNHEEAVFTVSKRGRPPAVGPKKPRIRVRLVGVNRESRAGYVPLPKRPKLILAPSPRVANPHPPRLGGYRAYPIEAIEMLRRVA